MTEKNRIIGVLGESKLLLPALLHTAIAANGQAKYLFALLQAARDRAEQPRSGYSNLVGERLACGLDEDDLDGVVAESRRIGADTYRIPRAERIIALITRNIRSMLEPLRESARTDFDDLTRRHQRFLLSGAGARHDIIDAETIALIIAADRDGGDSLRLIVSDAHHALERLQASIVAETIEGATVYDLTPEDGTLVKAFMRGMKKTAWAKFDHPGLGTTAARTAERLVIQNDIGTTDAHVLVVHVSGLQATVTYTDVHLQRLFFFENLLERYHVRWEDTVSRRDASLEDGVYHLSVGRYASRTRAELESFLAFLASRLVFLIDWNRARKRLRALLPKEAAIQLLRWSAEENHGHMAFLKCEGDRLVLEALDLVTGRLPGAAPRLDVFLGAEDAAMFMRIVLRACCAGLRRNAAPTFIRDEVTRELLARSVSARSQGPRANVALFTRNVVQREPREALE